MARLRALAAEKTDPDLIGEVEAVARDALTRKAMEIVGPVKVEGFADETKSRLPPLSAGPVFGPLDGLELRGQDGRFAGALVVTTRRLLRLWLSDYPGTVRPAWTREVVRALKADSFYADALNPGDGFQGVADIALPKPKGAAFAAAKLGRRRRPDGGPPHPALIVTVVTGARVYIVEQEPAAKLPDIHECAENAGSLETLQEPVGWGAPDGAAFEAWRQCVRGKLPNAPDFVRLKREAREIADRLARASNGIAPGRNAGDAGASPRAQ